MNNVLVPIDDASDLRWVVNQAIERYRKEAVGVHLLNVQRPLPRHVTRFFNNGNLRNYYHDTGMRVLEPAIGMLDQAGIPHSDHVLVGPKAETIVRFAAECQCGQIILDNRAREPFAFFGLGSIGSQVRHLMDVGAGGASPTEASHRVN
ncbi:MAG: universal stress protein [Burkholderiales bacterium]